MCWKIHMLYFAIILLTYGISVSASVHDVTMVLPRLIFPVNRGTMIRCVADEDYELELEIEINIGNGLDIPTEATLGSIEPEGWPGIQLEIPKSAGAKRFGAFRCSSRDNATDITKTAVGIVLPTSAQTFPKQSTYRANAGESIEMEVIQPRPMDYEELMWVQLSANGRPRPHANGELVNTIENPQPHQSGIYLVTFPTPDFNRRLYQQSLFRLIVRGCPHDKFGPICQEECLDCKNGGVCDMDDGTCVCPAGFGGPTCEKICGANNFGPDCQHQCDENENIGCKGKIFCRPDPLGCTCAAGFSGIVCNAQCQSGYYGTNCEGKCHCLKEECDPFSGECIDGGCAAGWTGINCQETCPPFSYGPDCKTSCGLCYGDLSCNRTSGECPGAMVMDVDEGSAFYSHELEHVELDEDEQTIFYCDYGYVSPICDHACDNGTWWKDCIRECHCMGGAACNPMSGECLPATANETAGSCAAGWMGSACDERCENGTHGLDCEETCGACAGDSPCNSETGKCEQAGPKRELCLPGFVPPYCDELCPEGSFGINCTSKCRCHKSDTCDVVDGACKDLCATGFSGHGCQETCTNGTYGLGCMEQCGRCLDKVACDVFNGSCPNGCMLGWAGETCHNATLCDEYNCQNNGTCEQNDSIYRCHCPIGYAGGHCEKPLPPCHSMPCQNQGMCMDVGADDYICQCFFSYSGKNCEVYLEGMLKNDSRSLYAVIAALAAIALVLGIAGILAYKCRSEDIVHDIKTAVDCEASMQSDLPDVGKPPTMHRRREGSIKMPRRFRGKAPPKTVTMKAGNRRIRVSRKMLGKSSLFSDGSSCHLSRMTTNSLFDFYDQPKTGDTTKRGFLNQCKQEPPSLSNKNKTTGFHNNLSTNYPNVSRNEWLDQDFRWGGISRGKHLQDSPHPLRSNDRRKPINNVKMPIGVPLSDHRSLITQARDADEEFEMEVRRDRKHGPGNPGSTDVSSNEFQRKADRARRRSRPHPKTNKQRPSMPKIQEETDYPPPSFRLSSPFPSRNRVANVTMPTKRNRTRHRDPRLSQSLNTRQRYRNSNVHPTTDDASNHRDRKKHSHRKSSHRKGEHRRQEKTKEHDDEYY